jgi:hypothetical protein
MNKVTSSYLLNIERRAAPRCRFCLEQAAHHTEQASRPEDGGAALHVFIAGDRSEVETTFCSVEPEHAAAMLMVPDEVRARLVGVVAAAGLNMNAPAKEPRGLGRTWCPAGSLRSEGLGLVDRRPGRGSQCRAYAGVWGCGRSMRR